MANSERVVVVVDPYSSGKFLVSELASQQWPMVCIQSSQDLADFWLAQLIPEHFVDVVRHESMEKTLESLSRFNVVAVMAGSEPGVLLAEDLQEALKLAGNRAATKAWRRNKYDMQERLREVGIRAVRQLYSSDVDEVLAWQRQWGKWPVIVKPSMSGGTDGVYWCHCAEDVREAFEAECGKLNVNGVLNEKLLVQEYLDGLEYIVDTVSFEGKHVLNGIWVYQKHKDPATKSITYEFARFLASTGDVQDALVDYVFQCLDALGIEVGPAHSEVIMCSDGPCLVETGARMHGLKGPKLTEYATGLGTHELFADVVLNGGRVFKELHARSYRYVVKKWAFETMMLNRSKEGVLIETLDNPRLRSLPSVMDIFPSVQPGQELKVTRDLATCPGVITMVHASLEQCIKDIDALRSMEAEDLFQVEAMPAHSKDEIKDDAPRPASRDASPFTRSPSALSRQTSPFTYSPPRRRRSARSPVANPQGEDEPNGSEFGMSGFDD